jgi:hypothetical protein
MTFYLEEKSNFLGKNPLGFFPEGKIWGEAPAVGFANSMVGEPHLRGPMLRIGAKMPRHPKISS